MKLCSVCQRSEAVRDGKCRAHYNEWNRTRVKRIYHRRRDAALAALGGVCVDCGDTDQLEFDHIDRTIKTMALGRMFGTASEKKLQAEVVKCVLRCKECHKAKTLRDGDYLPVWR